MKKLILSLSLLLSVARADFCAGQPIEDITTRFKLLHMDGSSARLLNWEQSQCGGAVDPVGESIPAWTCVVQTWRIATMGMSTFDATLFYGWANGWKLSGVVTALPDGTQVERLRLPACGSTPVGDAPFVVES